MSNAMGEMLQAAVNGKAAAEKRLAAVCEDRDHWKQLAELRGAALEPIQRELAHQQEVADSVLGFVKDLSASTAVPQEVRLKARALLKAREAAYDKEHGVK
jgi:hypothetical protein